MRAFLLGPPSISFSSWEGWAGSINKDSHSPLVPENRYRRWAWAGIFLGPSGGSKPSPFWP